MVGRKPPHECLMCSLPYSAFLQTDFPFPPPAFPPGLIINRPNKKKHPLAYAAKRLQEIGG